MPKISAERQQDRHNDIVEAARLVFARRGFEAAFIGEIAQEAGVSTGLIYRYFGGKRDLLTAVLAGFYQRVIERLDDVVAHSEGFRAKLRAIVATHIEVFVSDSDLCRLFLIEVRVASDYRSSAIYGLNRRYTAILLRAAEAGIAEGAVREGLDPRLLRDMLFGGIEHFAWRYLADGDSIDTAVSASQIADILINGTCKPQ